VRILALLLTIVALLTGACGGATGVRQTEAQRCTEGGGIWRTATEFCEQSSGGGGGGY
jgi:hypothetical protein